MAKILEVIVMEYDSEQRKYGGFYKTLRFRGYVRKPAKQRAVMERMRLMDAVDVTQLTKEERELVQAD